MATEPAAPATSMPTIQPQEEDPPATDPATDTPALQPQEDEDPPSAHATNMAIIQPQEEDPPAADPATDTPALQPQQDEDPPAAPATNMATIQPQEEDLAATDPATRTPALQSLEDRDPPAAAAIDLPSIEPQEEDPPPSSSAAAAGCNDKGFLCKIVSFLLISIANLGVSTVFATVFSMIYCFMYFHPRTLNPRIGSAVITTFDLPSSYTSGAHSALLYNLTLNITFINKSSMTKVHFDRVIAGLYYGGTKVGPSDYSVPRFKLKPEGSRRVSVALRGQAKKVSAAMAEAFVRERGEGLFNLNVKVKTILNYRFFPHRVTYYYEYDCWLQFPPVPGNGTLAVTGGFKCGRSR